MANQQLIDSRFLFALFNQSDKNHAAAMKFSEANSTPILLPTITLPEVSFLFLRDTGHHGVITFIKSLTQANLTRVELTDADLQRAGEIMEGYASAKFDLVDCCMMALSERLEIEEILTFDRRDFSIFRPQHCDFLTLLP